MTFPASARSFTIVPSAGMLGLGVGTYSETITLRRGTEVDTVTVRVVVSAPGPPPPPPPPPATTTHTLSYREPATNANGTPLTTLASVRAYWRIGNGPESVTEYAASRPQGGNDRTHSLTVPATSGTLTVQVTAVNTAGGESARSAAVSKVITAGGKPLPAGNGSLTLNP